MTAKLTIGTVFAGRYRVVRELAAGGMGAVYEVEHVETERRRALKVMHSHLFLSDDLRERFKRETRIAAQIESEHIVDVSDAGVDDATKMPFLVMEMLRGEDLGDRLERVGALPPGEVVTYLQQAAAALDKTHACGIVHRDLKPQNLFLSQREDGTPRIKILDFGIAKVVREGATATGATQMMGTPLYMAPEQFRAGSTLAPTADVYALGMMAYTLLAGEAYWASEARSAGDVIAFVMTAVHGPVEPATRRAAACGVTLPPGFDAWFAKVTAVSPAGRFQTASEAVRELAEVLRTAGSTTLVLPPIPGLLPQGTRSDAPARNGSDTRSPPHASSLESATTTSAASTSVSARRSRRPLLGIVAALGIAALGVAAWLLLRNGSTNAPAHDLGSAAPAHDLGPAQGTIAVNTTLPAATTTAEVAPSAEPSTSPSGDAGSAPMATSAQPVASTPRATKPGLPMLTATPATAAVTVAHSPTAAPTVAKTTVPSATTAPKLIGRE